jgi:hypothetical protein
VILHVCVGDFAGFVCITGNVSVGSHICSSPSVAKQHGNTVVDVMRDEIEVFMSEFGMAEYF